MKVLEELVRRAGRGEACALATVVATEGSSPGRPAMRMLSGPHGRIRGSIGGGHVEKTVVDQSRRALETGRPRVLSFTLEDDQAEEGGLLCGGTVRILVERVGPPADWARAALDLAARGERGALLARIGDRVEREVVSGSGAESWLQSEEPHLEGSCFVEPLVRPRCIVVGAGHVGAAVARLAERMGFSVVTVDDRPEQVERLEAGRTVCAPLEEGLGSLAPGARDYVVVVTRGHGLDLCCARAALRAGARYVGMLGAKRKAAFVREALRKEGVADDRLHSPVGLDIGARTVEEIALSIVAQMVRLRRTGAVDRPPPPHGS
ncbi:MAG: XdhC family protein [Planctomycetota bacterium]